MGKKTHDICSLLKGLIFARGMQIKEAAELAGLSRPRISKFLNGAHELRGDNLVALLNAVGIDLEAIIQQEISQTVLGEIETKSLGTDLELILDSLPPLEQKTLLNTLIRKANMNYVEGIDDAIHRVEDYKDRITFKRRGAC